MILTLTAELPDSEPMNVRVEFPDSAVQGDWRGINKGDNDALRRLANRLLDVLAFG